MYKTTVMAWPVSLALKPRWLPLVRKEGVVDRLDEIMSLSGDDPFRNDIGPVGVYKRNTFSSRDGYASLKAWEAQSGFKCRLVVTVGAYASIANFIGYANMKGEDWVYSAVSFTGAENLRNALREFGINRNVIVTQVVPPLDSKLPNRAAGQSGAGQQSQLCHPGRLHRRPHDAQSAGEYAGQGYYTRFISFCHSRVRRSI